jgi:hypothetical protein
MKMVDFDPRFTEVVYFDIECYVPPGSRQQTMRTLICNPADPDHFVLGGVFQRGFPLQRKMEEPWHIWNWSKGGEKDTLLQIYSYLNKSWQMIEGKSSNHPDLILAGIGISKLDVPALYIRSVPHKIDSETALFETYFKTKIVDLSDVGIGLFRNNPTIYPIYPKSANALLSRLKIQSHKTSGKTVWDLYDSQNFEAIKERTACEVEDVVEIASRIATGGF